MLLLGGVCTKSVACSVMLMALLLVAGAQETAAPMMPSGNKTIYVLPKGGLGNQLRFLASMLPLHNKWNINLQVVWEEQTDALDTVGSFKDYFSGTPVPLGPWPSGHKGGDWSKFGCKLHWIAGFTFAQAFADGWWEKGSNGGHTLCIASGHPSTESSWSDQMAFYKHLKPSDRVQKIMDQVKNNLEWDKSQWVGVHIRRSDNAADYNEHCHLPEGHNPFEKEFALRNWVQPMQHLQNAMACASKPLKFFLATDDKSAADELQRTFGLGLIKDNKDWSIPRRGSLSSLLEAAADIFLLSEAHAMIGTFYSTFTSTAIMIASEDRLTWTVGNCQAPCQRNHQVNSNQSE